LQILRAVWIVARSVRSSLCNATVNALPSGLVADNVLRPALARLYGVRCGRQSAIGRKVYFTEPTNIRIGDGVRINREVYLDSYGAIVLADHVSIGFRVTITTASHEVGPSQRRAGGLVPKPVSVETGCWIGAKAFIGPGVTLGAGCVVLPGAVVLRSMPPNHLIGGNPARPVQALER
jgi:maltose O-acetyltransferase